MFFFSLNLWFWWTSINRYHGFHTLAKRRFFARFSGTRRNMPAFKPFLQYFLKDLTPLHVRITRSTNLLSVCQRKLKLSTYLHCIDISFLNTRSQLVWVLGTAGSSGLYSMTRRMISTNSFSKTASIQRKRHPNISYGWVFQLLYKSRSSLQALRARKLRFDFRPRKVIEYRGLSSSKFR